MWVSAVETRAPGTAHVRTPGEALRVGAIAAVVAVVANLLVLLVGRSTGADMVLGAPGATAQQVGVVPVVVATLVGLVAGTLLLLVLRNRGHRAWTAVAIAGLAVGLASIAAPLSMPAERSTQLTLAAMHGVTGVVWFVLVRREAKARPDRAV